MKKKIIPLFPEVGNYSIDCLMNNTQPLYARSGRVKSEIITMQWMPLDTSLMATLPEWKILSSLCYLPELGMGRIWASVALVISYTPHFQRGIPIFPLLLKSNGTTILQVDCLPKRINKNSYLNLPFTKAVYLGIRYNPTSNYRQGNLSFVLGYFMPVILDFLSCLGNNDPVILVTARKELLEKIPKRLNGNYSTRFFHYSNKRSLWLIVFTKNKE